MEPLESTSSSSDTVSSSTEDALESLSVVPEVTVSLSFVSLLENRGESQTNESLAVTDVSELLIMRIPISSSDDEVRNDAFRLGSSYT